MLASVTAVFTRSASALTDMPERQPPRYVAVMSRCFA